MTNSCGLYLRIPAKQCAAVDIPSLPLAGQVSAILITDIESAPVASLRTFIASAGSQNVAVLVENDAALAKTLDADGVHLRAHSHSVDNARKLLGGDKAVGVLCPLTRHDAMEVGEAGASYIAFDDDGAGGLGEVAAMIRWWDELFEVPCVAWGHEGYDEATLRLLIDAGADFLSMPFPRVTGPGAAQEITRWARICAASGVAD
jgi:thiamine-phosphate pyrophosphorylase